MSIMDIGILTGFKPDQESLKKVVIFLFIFMFLIFLLLVMMLFQSQSIAVVAADSVVSHVENRLDLDVAEVAFCRKSRLGFKSRQWRIVPHIFIVGYAAWCILDNLIILTKYPRIRPLEKNAPL